MKQLIGKRGLKLDQADEIVAALKAVNGKGYDYAITEISEVVAIAKDAEAKLAAICLPESSRVGATAVFRSSGGTRPYKSWTPHRAGTRLELRRFKEGWRVMAAYASKSTAARTKSWKSRSMPSSARRPSGTSSASSTRAANTTRQPNGTRGHTPRPSPERLP